MQELEEWFQDLAGRLQPYLVAQRAEKEMRELVEQFEGPAFRHRCGKRAERRRRVLLLEEHAQACTKCGNRMVLRDRPSSAFWSCSAFPKCFSRRFLTKAESNRLAV